MNSTCLSHHKEKIQFRTRKIFSLSEKEWDIWCFLFLNFTNFQCLNLHFLRSSDKRSDKKMLVMFLWDLFGSDPVNVKDMHFMSNNQQVADIPMA